MAQRLIALTVLVLLAWGCDSTSSQQAAPETPKTAERPAAASDKADQGAAAKPAAETPPDFSKLKGDALREALVANLIETLLEEDHLRRKPVDDEVSQAAFKVFLERLDPGKLYLLGEQAEALEASADQIDDQLKAGKLALAHQGGKVLRERSVVVQKIIAEHLKEPFDYTLDETHETDAEKRQWCKTEDELKERWRKVLKLGVMSRIMRMEEADKAREEAGRPAKADAPKTFEERERAAREKLGKDWDARFKRMAQETAIDDVEHFINAVTSVYDPHTVYLPPRRKEDFDIHMSGSLEGIGAVLGVKEHFVEVVRVVPGGASWRQGELEAGDLILSVAQADQDAVDVVDMRLQDVVRLIRGPKGTVVTLTIQKPDDAVKVINITRDVVQIEASYAKGATLEHPDLPGKVGYIDLPSFYGNTRAVRGNTPQRRCTDDVRALLERFAKDKVAGVVLDLRGNGGGLLSAARSMSGLFFEKGPVVQTRSVDGRTEVLKDFDPSTIYDGPVIVLVDRFSASASEILAGALQDYQRAIIVGPSQTHGKGTVQFITALNEVAMERHGMTPAAAGDLGVLKFTRQQFFRVNGASTQHRGIVPDIILPDAMAHVESGERYLDYSIPWSSVDDVSFDAWPKGRGDVKALDAKSKTRQGDSPDFERVRKRIDLFKAQRDRTVETLNFEQWRAQRDKERAELDALKDDGDKAPSRFKVSPINYANTPEPPPRPNQGTKTDKEERKDSWEEGLSRDPWLEESLFILRDAITP